MNEKPPHKEHAMWPWILGAAAGIAGLAYLAHKTKQRNERAKSEEQRDAERAAPAPAHASYWEASGRASHADSDAEARAADTEALARIVQSEAGPMRRPVKVMMAWIARNRSLRIKRSLHDMAAPEGEYGPLADKRPMSSSQPATDETRAIAEAVLRAPQSKDPTPSATHGFDTRLQDRLAEQGIARNDAATVMKNWETDYGLKKVASFDGWVLYRWHSARGHGGSRASGSHELACHA